MEAYQKFWPGKNKSNVITEINGKLDDKSKADEINKFVRAIGERFSQDIATPSPNVVEQIIRCMPIYLPTFEFRELTLLDIAVLNAFLSPSTSCGVDGPNTRLLKATGPSILPSIQHIFNLSIAILCQMLSWRTKN